MRLGIIAGNTVINAMYDDLARAVSVAVIAHSARDGIKQVIPPNARGAILRDVDNALDAIFPKQRGRGCLLEEAIVGQAARVMVKPVAHAVAAIEAADIELARAAMPRDRSTK